jgi:hypothetical protein
MTPVLPVLTQNNKAMNGERLNRGRRVAATGPWQKPDQGGSISTLDIRHVMGNYEWCAFH